MESTQPKMLITSMPIRGFIATFVVFLALFLACVIIGALGPQVYHYRQVSAYRCPPNVNTFDPDAGCEGVDLGLPNSKWSGEIQNLVKMNQEISLSATLVNKQYKTIGIYQDVTFQVDMAGKNDADGTWVTILRDDAHQHTVSCAIGNPLCSNITLAWDLYIRYPFYQFNVTILDASAFLGDVYFTFIYVDRSYTVFELWFRFSFLVITFFVVLLFAHRLRNFRWNNWTLEQKWSAVILFGLMLYNNPFYPLELIANHWFPIFLNRLLYGTFIVILFLFWLVMFDGVRFQHDPNQKTFKWFYLPKIILIGLFWFFAVTEFTWAQLQLLNDPSYGTPADEPGFVAVSFFLLLFVVVYAFWLVFIICRSCGDGKLLGTVHIRVRFFGIFTLLVTIVSVSGVIYGAVSNRFNNSAEFVSFLALFNLYCYTLAFVYLPARGAVPSVHADKIGMVRLEEDDEDSFEYNLNAKDENDHPQIQLDEEEEEEEGDKDNKK